MDITEENAQELQRRVLSVIKRYSGISSIEYFMKISNIEKTQIKDLMEKVSMAV
ncbi:MAG: hypothetical protein MUP85_10940 [Candidatus Lokiarchaeota archaeon]|nr:hypothetical protein [Candidatus Lokiarchaeota archaeon]